ncbi:ecto-ADP-ribosyltransferase 4-like [Xyrichtys novacula]|uniref:NAD(P)(+)--arginine ADP-ribosyltransferase n=1 Tax=Xyrichtys novacula TaxID=13765 RepID=A0AAV1EV13_XYRNO|nr:ecto-ADP-ribosyltransferase 4-like [Xyrichtys novacula]
METKTGPVFGLKSRSNWVTLFVLLVVTLLLYHDPLVLLWWPQKPAEKTKASILPLDMATQSIDDMFDGCRSKAASIIDLFGVYEWHFNRKFSFAWSIAEKSAKKPAHKQLKDDHAIALYIFTKVKNIRREFNNVVKTGKHKYSTREFKFHYLYFYLTHAIQALHQNNTLCRTTYLRTQTHFNVLDSHMRFGAFTWVATSKQAFSFNGNLSCFEIHTCFGARITYYSATKQKGQVLIPPYEVFQITNILRDDPWCTVVYKLQSTKTPMTDLNCKLRKEELDEYFGGVLANWRWSSRVWMMLACVILLIVISLILLKYRQKSFVVLVLGGLLVWVIILVVLRVLMKD